MPFHAHPRGGVYSVKVDQGNFYWKYVPDSGRIQLAAVDKSSEDSPGLLYKWHISPNKTSTAFTIRPAYNLDFALVKDQSGNPKAAKEESSSDKWVITAQRHGYSTIKFNDASLNVLGCSDPTTDPLINFESPDSSINQRFVFRFAVSPRLALYTPTFGYGSNIWDDQMKRRCPDHVYSCISRLDDWKWIINERRVATIVPSPGDYVWGTVLLLHAHDEQRLDGYEGPDYVKSIVAVDLDGVKRNPGAVLTYIDKNTTPGRPRDEYVLRLRKAMADGKKKGIPKAYFDKYWEPFLPSASVGSNVAEAEAELEEE